MFLARTQDDKMSIRMLFTKYTHVVYVTSLLAEIFVTAHQKKMHPVESENETLPASRPDGLTDGRTDGQTDRQTHTQTYRRALKRNLIFERAE